MTSLVILGTGGAAHDVIDIVEAINRTAPIWEVVGFLDDARPAGTRHLGLEVLGPLSEAQRYPTEWLFINAIGSDLTYRSRPEILASTTLEPSRFATMVHPAASVSTRARVGRGVAIHPGASIAGGVEIGDHVTVCPGVIVGHDSVIEDFAILAPGAIVSGSVHVGRAAYLGAGSMIRQKVSVGHQALVGLGAVVVADVLPEMVVVGNPGRPRR
jgi:sugar O-acyltransferase (sialic acid O-acetyltransferase NeuD family)